MAGRLFALATGSPRGGRVSGGTVQDAMEAVLGGAGLWFPASGFCVCRYWAFRSSKSDAGFCPQRFVAAIDLVAGAKVAGRSGSVFKIGGEAFPELISCAEEEALHCGQGHLENIAKLFVRKLLVAAEDDCKSLFFRQRGDSVFERFFEFFLLGLDVRARGGVVSELSGLVVFGFGFERYFLSATATASFVEDQVASDCVKPGGEFGSGFIAGRALPDADEDLLGDIMSIIDIAEHPRYGSNDGILVEFNELLKGMNVALFDLEHELGADILRGHKVCFCLSGQGGVHGLGMPGGFRHEQTGGEHGESSGTH